MADEVLTIEQELIADLTEELSIDDENFSEKLLASKVKNAVREVKQARNYPSEYTDEQISKDVKRFYSNCRNIALNDYNKIGQDFEESHSENGVTQKHTDRLKLFSGIVPICRV